MHLDLKIYSEGIATSDGEEVNIKIRFSHNSQLLRTEDQIDMPLPNAIPAIFKSNNQRIQKKWLPGKSVSNRMGKAGSIGAFVRIPPETAEQLELPSYFSDISYGFLSASHVLSVNGTVRKHDYIHSPGFPDIKQRLMRYRCGRLIDFVELEPITDTLEESPINYSDVALASYDKGEIPMNLVPSPSNPKVLLPISGVMSLDEILNNKNSISVYMTGRSTPFSKGILVLKKINCVPMRMSNQKYYLFGDCLMVDSEYDEISYSQPGDSGAMVYSEDLRAVGFILGGSGRYSFIFPAEKYLEDLGVELITNQ